MNWKIVAPWILAFIFIATSGYLGYTSYRYRSDYNDIKQELKDYKKDAQKSSGKATDSTEYTDWQTVVKADDYTFQYPAEWYIEYFDKDRETLSFISDFDDFAGYQPSTFGIPADSTVMNFMILDKAPIEEGGEGVVIDSEDDFKAYIDTVYIEEGAMAYKLEEEKDLTINGFVAKKISGLAPAGGYGASKFVSFILYDSTNKRVISFDNTYVEYTGSLDRYADNISKIEKAAKSFTLI